MPAASSPENTAAYKAKLADFICQGAGGPCKYTGVDMFTAHKGRGVTDDAFNAVVSDLVAARQAARSAAREGSVARPAGANEAGDRTGKAVNGRSGIRGQAAQSGGRRLYLLHLLPVRRGEGGV